MSAATQPEAGDRGLFARGIRLIASYIRAHPKPFVISVMGAALFAAGSIAVTAALGIGVRRYFSGVLGSAVAATLRRRVSDRYRDLSLAYHRATPTGELLAHMEADVEASVDVLYPVPFAVGVILLVLFAMVAMVLIDPLLALIGFLLFPTLGLLNRTFARRMQGPALRAQERIGEVSSVAHESVDGALVVKTLGRERAETERLAAKAEELRRARVDGGLIRAGFEPALEALPALAITVLMAVGSWRISDGAMSIGDLVQVVTLFGLLAWPMRFVGWILSELPRAIVGHDRIVRVLEEPTTIRVSERPARIPGGPLDLRVEGLGHALDGARVLEDVTFHVRPNESIALVGPTGVGKSTLAQLLVRLDDPTEGRILLGGVDLRQAEARSLRAAATLVFQESFLFATTVAENIALDEEVSREEIERAARVAQADRFVRALPEGYDTVLGERGATLSGGERQRVALARAIARRPRLLILDDATSAVDPTIEARILAGIREEHDATLIVVAYRLSTIRLADRVLYLEDGRLVASGSHDELMASQRGYAAMVHAYERGER